MTDEGNPLVSPPDKVPGLRTFLEQSIGLTLDPELVARLERGLGTKIDDEPGRWAEVEKTLMAAAGEDTLAAFTTVQTVFERLLEEAAAARPNAALACLPTWTPGERAIVATRVIGSEIDNNGSPGIFFNGEDGLLPDAIEGFRLLGLDDNADALAELVASGFNGESPEEAGEAFEEAWFSLPDAEPARAAYIAAHPEQFRR